MTTEFASSLDRLKESFLWAAAQGGNIQDCESLLEIGSDINWKGQAGDTSLLAACRCGHSETVAFLLARGADITAIGNDSHNALHICAEKNDILTLNVLLDAGVSIKGKTRSGLTAFDIAKSKHHDNICDHLMRSTRTFIPSHTIPSHTDVESKESINGRGHFLSSSSSSTSSSSSRVVQSERTERTEIALNNHRSILPSLAASAPPNATQKLSTLLGNSYDDHDTLNRGGYSLIGQGQGPGQSKNYALSSSMTEKGDDETVSSLKRCLDIEQKDRKIVEAKVMLLNEKNGFYVHEITNLKKEATINEHIHKLTVELLDQFLGTKKALSSLDLFHCEELEKKLKNSLENLEERKAALIRDQMDQQKEQRYCVICQAKEKSVVLLPCRHMCLCDDCSGSNKIEFCPLCRRPIAHRISVYA
mmetsp:Transcript_15981/g.15342  ORF Transcript_15981/g.15342 Transcript_15981/m.15342 type:complete len:419 (+) Transcript_15981:261-1517(+)